MASQIIGRTACPECGFESAHVKRNAEKGTLYRYCPGCGAQYFPKGEEAVKRLQAKTRPLEPPAGLASATAVMQVPRGEAMVIDPPGSAATDDPAPEPAVAPAPATAPKRAGFFTW